MCKVECLLVLEKVIQVFANHADTVMSKLKESVSLQKKVGDNKKGLGEKS